MDDPYPVEIDEEMSEGALLEVCLEKDAVPVDFGQPQVSLRSWKIDKSSLKGRN